MPGPWRCKPSAVTPLRYRPGDGLLRSPLQQSSLDLPVPASRRKACGSWVGGGGGGPPGRLAVSRSVTVRGLEDHGRCDASTLCDLVVRRLAMASCNASGMWRGSAVAQRAHDGRSSRRGRHSPESTPPRRVSFAIALGTASTSCLGGGQSSVAMQAGVQPLLDLYCVAHRPLGGARERTTVPFSGIAHDRGIGASTGEGLALRWRRRRLLKRGPCLSVAGGGVG